MVLLFKSNKVRAIVYEKMEKIAYFLKIYALIDYIILIREFFMNNVGKYIILQTNKQWNDNYQAKEKLLVNRI